VTGRGSRAARSSHRTSPTSSTLKGVKLAAALDDDAHVRLTVLAGGQAQPTPHIHRRDDAPAQVQRPRHLERRQRHPVDPHRRDHVLNPQQGDADHLIADANRDKAFQRRFGRRGCHAAS
jgi:hypothetical protein